jgi:hypothetical protein
MYFYLQYVGWIFLSLNIFQNSVKCSWSRLFKNWTVIEPYIAPQLEQWQPCRCSDCTYFNVRNVRHNIIVPPFNISRNALTTFPSVILLYCCENCMAFNYCVYYYVYCIQWGQDSVVGIVTGYGLDDRGVGVRVLVGSRIFSMSSRPALGSTQPPI